MPIYEYTCPTCGNSFGKLIRSMAAATEVVCPTCGNADVRKKVSTFSSSVKGGSAPSTNSAPSCSSGGLWGIRH